MDHISKIRPFTLNIGLRPEEQELLETEARRLNVSRAEVLRKACPQVFMETGVKRGRRAGESPWKLERVKTA
jgi:hypothetical protein